MRYMVLMIPGNAYDEKDAMPDPEMVGKMMKYNEELANAGILLALDGLHAPSKGSRVKFTGDKPTISDGPFAEATEVVGGYWLWQVKSKEEALEWARRCPAQAGDTLELRQVFEPSEFGADVAAKGEEILSTAARNR